jgi:hypothetical protein
LVFDRSGRVTKVLEGAEQTPFRLVSNLLLGPDGLLRLYDGLSQKVHQLDSEFRDAGTSPLRYFPALILRDGRYIVSTQIPSPDLVGQPLHLVGKDGTVVKSFGSDDGTYRADEPRKYRRVVAPSADGAFWSVAPGRYVLEQWESVTGSKKKHVTAVSSWFRESVRAPDAGQKPTPVILSLWEVDGLLWVLLQDADADWQPPTTPPRDAAFDPDEHDRRYDCVLEVVDPISGKVLASRRYGHALWGRAPSFLLASRVPSGSGNQTQIDVWRPRLVVGKEEP